MGNRHNRRARHKRHKARTVTRKNLVWLRTDWMKHGPTVTKQHRRLGTQTSSRDMFSLLLKKFYRPVILDYLLAPSPLKVWLNSMKMSDVDS